MDEEFYIKGLFEGDEQVFRGIFERYHTRLCYFAAALLTTDQDVEDVVQEAFVKLWQRRRHFQDSNSIKAFLYIAVKNRCLNICKHDQVVRKYGDRLEEGQENDAMSSLVEAEVLENIHQALQKLPLGCRSVLHLSYFEGMKNKAIAEQLHVSINTVKTQKLRGLRLLRGLLKSAPLFILILGHFF
jgi:RNA polymerase sigma-70 factor (ECF subfamily)